HPKQPPQVPCRATSPRAQPRDVARALGHSLDEPLLLDRLGVPGRGAFVARRAMLLHRHARVERLEYSLVLPPAARAPVLLDAFLTRPHLDGAPDQSIGHRVTIAPHVAVALGGPDPVMKLLDIRHVR